ncbi:MurR/RpiR family transcriptional regulator [Halobacillus amylolyticus]|uniref:MurR/RpiR family transcriptional regulator n=1 Tax=Halobacillus amylolyticus TaxID=2932259 RepID=A0ABY4HAN6_9BACI|nr:MurR/RpiR family transcriptional regulator [Halobacillus amylolyticus]UOR11358.1 MurR/RpiR family transcriptional regulator [Halobacillus amylolyticus]
MDDLFKKVERSYDDLSKGLKKVATLLLEEPTAFAANPAKKVGESLGVSESMITRFCLTLGYEGYSQLQKEVREYVFNQKRNFEEYSLSNEDDKERPFHEQVMLHDQVNIQSTSKNIGEDQFNEAVTYLTNAEHVLISGLRYNFSMAHWLTYALQSIGTNAKLYRPDLDAHLEFGSQKHVFIVFSFHAYSTETLMLAEEAKRRGWVIIGITDSGIAPISNYADILFPVYFSKGNHSETAPIVFSFMNALVSGISLQEPERTRQSKLKMEEKRLKQTFKL